ncbi:DUF4032 domain-containing protein [Brevifollis gellanilyticus]|uniref:DUF4032 domain-containing protein n=1 Tax=Brevifollis gellanilyticus TaxID=748831 RepID=A0A512MB27_9BACT|nr:DUF4032 domain-containing protein [Brevifollis gellanilyticus]GEP43934.1 hypothetical protein BGE01nite_32250 [Brevifollis gellanilyticus]
MPHSNANRESSPYSEFQAELAEIHRHKWLVSEKEGQDIGFERALTEWVGKHRQGWRRGRSQNPVGK